jgi:hypothetical protein
MVYLGRRFGVDLNRFARSRVLGWLVVWLDRLSDCRRRSE